MSHSYAPACDCARCTKERARRATQAANDPRRLTAALQRNRTRKPPRERTASREEQHARYIDCGPQAWDDREES